MSEITKKMLFESNLPVIRICSKNQRLVKTLLEEVGKKSSCFNGVIMHDYLESIGRIHIQAVPFPKGKPTILSIDDTSAKQIKAAIEKVKAL